MSDKAKEFFSKRHPDYDKYAPMWSKMYSAYLGGEQFKSAYLWRYEREENNDWQERLKRSAYENHISDIAGQFDSIIFSRDIDRDIEDANDVLWTQMLNDFDLRGNEYKDFIKKCYKLSQVLGWLPVVLDKPQGAADTGADEIAKGLRPYAVIVMPWSFMNWGIDEGGLAWVVIKSEVVKDITPMSKADKVTEYRLIDREKTEVWHEIEDDKDTKFVRVNEIKHGLGRVPVVFFTDGEAEEGSIVTQPTLLDATELSIKLFNQTSWYDQLLYKTNYSTLAAVPFNKNSEEPEVVVGAGDVFWSPDGSSFPRWISPDVDPAEVFEKKIKDMRLRIYELASLDKGRPEDNRSDLSGVARSYDRKPTEDRAVKIGQHLERAEKALLELCGQLRGRKDYEPEIHYPNRYNVQTLDGALAIIETTEKLSSLPRRVKGMIAAQIVQTEAFVNKSDDEMRELMEEIENFDPVAEEIAKAEKLAEAESKPRIQETEIREQAATERARIEAEKPKDTGLFGGF